MKFRTLNLNKAIVVEFEEITLPEPKHLGFINKPAYSNQYEGKRHTAVLENQNQVNKFFTDLFFEVVYPELLQEPTVRDEYPFNLSFMKDNTFIGADFVKDDIGWEQPYHFDNRSYIMAGSFHLHDSLPNGTQIYGERKDYFQGSIYQTPSRKNSGGFWLNNMFSGHAVNKVVDTHRLFYLVHVLWKLNYTRWDPTEIKQYSKN